MSQHRIFYSWQSDHPNSTNRGFIEKALEDAAKSVRTDGSLAIEPVIDRDTRGLPGAPDIVHSIFEKIEQAAIFVCDVSIVSDQTAKRATPNPNVLIELGYAFRSLGHQRVILVMNTAYGGVEKLPFDLRHRRILTYEMSEMATDKAAKRRELSKELATGLKRILAHHLNTLDKRESYPGPTIARAWFDTVINPLLDGLKNERECLEMEKWDWGRYGGNLQEFIRISTLKDGEFVLNLEQITGMHSKLKSLIVEHDERVIELYQQVEKLFNKINESVELRELYSRLTSPQALKAAKERGSYRLSQCNTEEDLLNALFGYSSDADDRRAWLAHEIVNKSGELPGHIGHSPMWNINREELLTLLDRPAFQAGIQDLQRARDLLMQAIDRLKNELKQLRDDLAKRFQIPYASSDNISLPMESRVFSRLT